MTEPVPIDPTNVRPGPIRHDSLPPKLLEQIQVVYKYLRPYLDTTLEEFEIGFMRDAQPEAEIAIWCRITAAWITYHKKHLGNRGMPQENEKKLIGALLLISRGVEDAGVLGVPSEVGNKLLDCYDILRT